MKLPNHKQAVVVQAKIVDYLLAPQTSGGKAGFFIGFGFTRDTWEILAEALKYHAATYEISRTEASPFGVRYVVEGPLQTPVGRSPLVRTIWFIDTGEESPRFITAYPLKIKGPDNDPGI